MIHFHLTLISKPNKIFLSWTFQLSANLELDLWEVWIAVEYKINLSPYVHYAGRI